PSVRIALPGLGQLSQRGEQPHANHDAPRSRLVIAGQGYRWRNPAGIVSLDVVPRPALGSTASSGAASAGGAEPRSEARTGGGFVAGARRRARRRRGADRRRREPRAGVVVAPAGSRPRSAPAAGRDRRARP